MCCLGTNTPRTYKQTYGFCLHIWVSYKVTIEPCRTNISLLKAFLFEEYEMSYFSSSNIVFVKKKLHGDKQNHKIIIYKR